MKMLLLFTISILLASCGIDRFCSVINNKDVPIPKPSRYTPPLVLTRYSQERCAVLDAEYRGCNSRNLIRGLKISKYCNKKYSYWLKNCCALSSEENLVCRLGFDHDAFKRELYR